MGNVRIGVLGPLEVNVGGRPVEVPPGRRRAVLACLVIHHGHSVSSDELIEAAWGEHLPLDAHAALHTVVSRLRAVLGDVLQHDGPAGYHLDLPPHAVDAEEFLDLLERADTAGAKGAARLLEDALGLWRGPPYGELGDAPFATTEAMRLAALRADATERLAALAVDAGEPVTAIGLVEALLAEEPFRERAVEVLVTALYRGGRAADALAALREFRTRLADELGLDPGPGLRRLEQQVLGQDLPEEPRPRPPAWLDTSAAFIGREDEQADLVAAVVRNRLTVVTGPGGVGKSRLAAEALPVLHDRLNLPASVTELAPVTDGGVALAMATSLGLRPSSPEEAEDAVVDRLEASGGLVVIDNCEHVLDEVSAVVGRVVARCRDARVLATSRHRLGVDSELVLPLTPLAVPDEGDGHGAGVAASVRLVADRVRRISPSFAITADAEAQVGNLCRRLDGLPLALELVAARIGSRGLADVVDGLSEPVAGVDGLEGVVAWSHRLLTPPQQDLLMYLSVFTGEFAAREVRGLATHLPDPPGDIDADLAELVESSLVSRREDGVETRYGLLVTVRDVVAGWLRESGRSDRVHEAHAAWVRQLTSGILADWQHADGSVLAARLDDAVPEMVTALRWSLRVGRLDVAAAIGADVASCVHWTPTVELRSLMIEVAERAVAQPHPGLAGGVGAGAFTLVERGDLPGARRLARAALQMAGEDAEPMTAVLTLAVSAIYSGDRESSLRWFSQLAEMPGMLADANASLALSACYHDDLEGAREHIGIALAAGACGSEATFAFAHYAAGEIALTEDLDRGAALLRRAAQEADRVGAEQVGRVSRVALLAALTRDGHHDGAIALAARLLSDLSAKGAWPQLWTTLRITAELLADCGRPAEAAFVLAGSTAPVGPQVVGRDVERYEHLGSDLAHRLGGPAWAGIHRLAVSTPRTHLVDRAEATLGAIAAGPSMEP